LRRSARTRPNSSNQQQTKRPDKSDVKSGKLPGKSYGLADSQDNKTWVDLLKGANTQLEAGTADSVLRGKALTDPQISRINQEIQSELSKGSAANNTKLKALYAALEQDNQLRRQNDFILSLNVPTGASGGLALNIFAPVAPLSGLAGVGGPSPFGRRPWPACYCPSEPCAVYPAPAGDPTGGEVVVQTSTVKAPPDLSDDGTPILASDAAVPQTTRFLQVANATQEPVKLHVQYRAKSESGDFAWFPAAPGGGGEPMTFELAPGEQAALADNDWRLNASRVRIWADSPSKQWTQFKDQDLWLVPEVNEVGTHAYLAKDTQVFSYVVK